MEFCRPLEAQGLYLMSPRHRMRSKHDSDVDSELIPDLVGHAQRVRVGSSVAVEVCGQSIGEPRLVYQHDSSTARASELGDCVEEPVGAVEV